MSKYTPKQFSPRIYPEWGELLEDLSVEKQAEILNAIVKYPNENPSGGVWKFIKSQIDRDYEEFVERANKNKEIVKNYWKNKELKVEETGETMGNERYPTLTNDNEREPEHKQEHKQEQKQESLKKNKQKEKISFSDVDDWESLFTYWEENKKGGRYKNVESRQRMLDRLKELTGHNLEFAKQAICHCIDNGYQGFSNGNELFYKTQKIPIKTVETKPDAFEVFHQAMSEIRRRAAQ